MVKYHLEKVNEHLCVLKDDGGGYYQNYEQASRVYDSNYTCPTLAAKKNPFWIIERKKDDNTRKD